MASCKIELQEFEVLGEAVTTCRCLYNLNMEVNNVEPAVYRIEILTPHQTTYIFDRFASTKRRYFLW